MKLNVPTAEGNLELELENGVVLAMDEDNSPLPGGVAALDLYEQSGHSVEEAVKFLLGLGSYVMPEGMEEPEEDLEVDSF